MSKLQYTQGRQITRHSLEFSHAILRLLLQIAVQRELKIVTFDLERAFLQNALDRTNLFMTCPKDIVPPENNMVLLNRGIFSIKM